MQLHRPLHNAGGGIIVFVSFVMIKTLVTTVVLFCMTATVYAADTLFVSAIAEPGGDGQSWNAPYRSVSEAMGIAQYGDEVWLARGTYGIPATITMKEGVKLFGGFKGTESLREHRDWYRHETILTATGSTTTIFTMNDLDSATKLDGLILQGATASAVIVDGGAPVFFNCQFRNNSSERGGAIRATDVGRMRIEFCVFRDNASTMDGGAVNVTNGIADQTWGPFFGESLFYHNSAGGSGGAVALDGFTGRPQIASCAFVDNSASIGGAYHAVRCFSYVTNCTFVGNTVSVLPGGGRSVAYNGGYIQNSIFWNGNESDTTKHIIEVDVAEDTARVEVRACLVEADFDLGFWQSNPNFEDQGNVFGDDDFFGTDDDGLRLSSFSPVVDGGVIDGFVNHQPWDALGDPRLVGRKVDLGCYEEQRSGRRSHVEVMDELKQGKLVLFFRHAKTDWGSQDPGPSPECFPGRNLIHEGREQSREIGKMMNAQGLLVGDALSSPVCRCWETLELMVGYYEKKSHWASGGGDAVDSLRNEDLVTIPFNGIRLISSHDAVGQVVFNPDGDGSILTSAELQEADNVFVRPDGESFEVISHWCSETWKRYRVRFPDASVSVDEDVRSENSLQVYPNPANDMVTITVGGTQMISIVDLLGNIAWSGQVNSTISVELGDLASGMYIVRSENGQSSMLALQ